MCLHSVQTPLKQAKNDENTEERKREEMRKRKEVRMSGGRYLILDESFPKQMLFTTTLNKVFHTSRLRLKLCHRANSVIMGGPFCPLSPSLPLSVSLLDVSPPLFFYSSRCRRALFPTHSECFMLELQLPLTLFFWVPEAPVKLLHFLPCLAAASQACQVKLQQWSILHGEPKNKRRFKEVCDKLLFLFCFKMYRGTSCFNWLLDM